MLRAIIECDGCGFEQGDRQGKELSQIRVWAWSVGWKTIDDKDYCPQCVRERARNEKSNERAD